MRKNTGNTKVIIGLSGGVDSAVSAHLLQQEGYDVEALFMKNWEADDDDEYCSAREDFADAKAVCSKLNIPLHHVNFSKEYWDRVFQYFLDEYQAGRTPNPDVLCNKEIKFRAFLDYAFDMGADLIATGHYVRKKEIEGKTFLLKGKDSNKDQSYFLNALTENQIAKTLFPVGGLEKPLVRKIAEEIGLPNFSKKDSTGICFIGERKFKSFLEEYLLAQPGVMKTPEGRVIGKHNGLMYYTMGQRQGLGVGGEKDSDESPWYVLDKDIENNILIIGQGHDHPLLLKTELICIQPNWITDAPKLPFNCFAKTRYRQADQACKIVRSENEELKVTFEKPQRAITPGQYVVFYDGDICLGGGVIQ